MKRGFRFWLDWVLVLLFSSLLGKGMSYVHYFLLDSLPSLGFVSGFAIYSLIFSLLVVILYVLVSRMGFRKAGFVSPLPSHFMDAIVLFSLLFPIALLGRLIIPQFDFDYYDSSIAGGILAFFIVMLFFVVREELTERSMIQSTLMAHYSPIVVCIAVSLNFSLFHMTWLGALGWKNTLAMVISIIFGSFLVTVLFVRTSSILATLFFHLLNNVIIVTQIILHVKGFLLWEICLWVAWAALFVVFMKRGWRCISGLMSNNVFRGLGFLDYLILLFFSLVWPFLLT
ncbi:CPBP family intramembrane metalloprotease [Candidatus Woesearchaeota archaeon]|nr:CPBP family intramembrane metalloprotease [Candidatus Woesearchaeota archaeon]